VAQPASATQQLSSKPRERSDSNQIVVPFREIDQIIGKLQGQAKVDFEKSLIYTDINNAKGLVQTTDTAWNQAQEAIKSKPSTPSATSAPAKPTALTDKDLEQIIQQNKDQTISKMYAQAERDHGTKTANQLIRYFVKTKGQYNPTDLVRNYF
jgi:hypothetical protein